MYRGTYDLIGGELSMFSRKLEAQLRFQKIPYRWEFKSQDNSAELEARAGTHFIPLLRTPDKWLVHDTIALGPMLNDRFYEVPVIPQSAFQHACCFILEDAFNHWLGRVAVHSRWCYPDNVTWVGARFGANMLQGRSIDEGFSEEDLEQLTPVGQMMYEGFGKNVCEYNGVGPEYANAVQADYRNMIQVMAAVFAGQNFLLGARPCIADFAFAGPCKAHFVTDPEPHAWLGEHRDAIEAYTQRFFGEADFSTAQWSSDEAVASAIAPVLDYLENTYFAFARANISAGLAGEKYYEYDYGYGPTRARTQRRLNFARLHVRDELLRVDAQSDATVQATFAGRGILEHYLAQ